MLKATYNRIFILSLYNVPNSNYEKIKRRIFKFTTKMALFNEGHVLCAYNNLSCL